MIDKNKILLGINLKGDPTYSPIPKLKVFETTSTLVAAPNPSSNPLITPITVPPPFKGEFSKEKLKSIENL